MKLKQILVIALLVVLLVVGSNVALAVNQPATQHNTVTTTRDVPYVFRVSEFNFIDPNDTPADNFTRIRISLAPYRGDRFVTGSYNFAGTLLNGANQAGEFVSVTDISNGNFRFVSPSGETGLFTFIFQVEDDGSTATNCGSNGVQPCWRSNNYRMTINVTPSNSPPNAVNDAASTSQNTAVTVNVLANDTDADSNALTITTVGTAASGTAAIVTGGVRYTPNTNFVGTDSFTYTVSDGNSGTDTATVTITVQNQTLPQSSQLEISRIKINGKTNGKISLEEETEIEVEVRNNLNVDLDDVEVTVTVLDVDGDDIDESEEIDINDNDEEKVALAFDLNNEVLEEDSYEIEIKVEGRSNNVNYVDTERITVDVDREKHRVVIKRASLDRSTLSCSINSANLAVQIENVGESDEEDIEIIASNSALGLDARRDNIDLDDFSGNDNDYQTTIPIDLADAESGTYDIRVEVMRDGSLEDSETVTLEVQDCTGRTGSITETQGNSDLIEELQEGLKVRRDANLQDSSIRESKGYLVLLGSLALLAFVAVVLALAVLFIKKK